MAEDQPTLVPDFLQQETTADAELVSHASKGYVKDYNLFLNQTKGSQVLRSNTGPNLNRILYLIERDPIARGGINKLVDRALENGWYVKPFDKKSKERAAILKLKELKFNLVLRKTLFHLIMYGNSFIELVRNGNGEVVELNVLEPTLMRIEANNVGEVISYWQDVVGSNSVNGNPQWAPDDIIHLKNSFLTTSVWGDVDVASLETVISTKLFIKDFVQWLFETNQFRNFFAFKPETNDDNIKEFLAYYKNVQPFKEKPLAVRGEVVMEQLRQFTDETQFRSWLSKMDEETLILLGIPGLVLGYSSDGNRSTGDASILTFNTRVKSLQGLYADMTTFELLPKLGFKKVEFIFTPPDKKSIKDIIEIAERMVNMKIKPEYIEEFMSDEGFDLSDTEESIFYTPEEQMANGMMKSNLTGSADQYASRKGKAEGESSAKIGTGSEGTTREDQIMHADDNPVRKRWEYEVVLEDD